MFTRSITEDINNAKVMFEPTWELWDGDQYSKILTD